jgi:DNA-binding transcriptional MerR regulator
MDDSRDMEAAVGHVWASEPNEEGHSGDKTAFTIGELSREFGVTLRALRFYENKGLISPHREGMNRLYSPGDRTRLALILKGKKLGFTLTEIQDLIGGKGTTETVDLEDKLNPQQIVTQISHLERQRNEIEGAIERLRATQSRLAQGAAA